MEKHSNHNFGVIWDMDGVLVDTGEFHFHSWKMTMEEFSLSMTREEFQSTFGMNNAGVLESLYGMDPDSELSLQISDRKEEHFRAAVRGHVVPLPGVLDWLAQLRARGVRQAIATSAPPANIDVILDGLAIRDYVEAIVSGTGMPGKPDPAVYLKAAGALGLDPARCVVVEDAIAGVAGARNAGMKCIAVTTTNPASALQGADWIVDRLDQLPAGAFAGLWSGQISP